MPTLHFENDDEDDLRRVGMSEEHRVDPQVQVGLLVDPGGFPLEVHLVEGNQAECHHRGRSASFQINGQRLTFDPELPDAARHILNVPR